MEAPSLLSREPVVSRRDWLPRDTGFDTLDALGVEHVRLLDEWRSKVETCEALRQRFKDEDEARAQHLKAAYLGTAEGALPEATPGSEREPQLAAAVEQAQAAALAVNEFATSAIETVKQHRAEWQAALDVRDQQADALRQEAAELIARADAASGGGYRLRMWLHRTSGGSPLGHLTYAGITIPQPDPEPDWSAVRGEVHVA